MNASSRAIPQNGRHERMHLTLKKEATKPAAGNFLQQQARFDKFMDVFNNERPHEALDMKTAGSRGGIDIPKLLVIVVLSQNNYFFLRVIAQTLSCAHRSQNRT